MGILEAARSLGEEIQNDEVYKTYTSAKETAKNDKWISEMSEKLETIQSKYNEIAVNDPGNEKEMESLHSEYMSVYQEVYKSPLMLDLLESREKLDSIMNDVMQILFMCINGEDPDTCKPSPETMEKMQNNALSI